jgi:peptidoglycan/xylan/chitin deacetylase (PgdA/CDA1 family)
MSSEAFGAQLDIIREKGDPVSTIRDLCESCGRGKPVAQTGQAVVLTFDEGVSSHADPVLPMLWERRMPGEFFVNPVLVGRRGYLSWNELRGMASAGMSIQSHGYSHRPLDMLEPRAAHTATALENGAMVVIGGRNGDASTNRAERCTIEIVDGRPVKTVRQSPDYPMQFMLGLYEFPAEGAERRPESYPKEFVVDWVRGYRHAATYRRHR